MNEYVIMSGIDELVGDFDALIRAYPDRAGAFLYAEAKKAKRNTVNRMKRELHTHESTNPKSLALAKNYEIRGPKGYGANQYVELCATSPHFHLIEHGHEYIARANDGNTYTGVVQGYHIMDAVAGTHRARIGMDARKFAEKLLQEEGFL